MKSILFIVILFSLQQKNIWELIDEKAKELKTGRAELSKLEDIDSSFNDFYQRFITDSTFQYSRISESVLAAVFHCESTDVFTQEDWDLITYNFKEDFDNARYKHILVSDKDVFYLQTWLIEVGVISQIGFERIDGQWYITLFMVNVC
ncbi:MAG: hypothetical protein AAF620_12615 [Bacteroidota bacterium]